MFVCSYCSSTPNVLTVPLILFSFLPFLLFFCSSFPAISLLLLFLYYSYCPPIPTIPQFLLLFLFLCSYCFCCSLLTFLPILSFPLFELSLPVICTSPHRHREFVGFLMYLLIRRASLRYGLQLPVTLCLELFRPHSQPGLCVT